MNRNVMTEIGVLIDGTERQRADAFGAIASAAQAYAPPSALRGRLLGGLHLEGRLYRFASAVADLLDVPVERAKSILDRVERKEEWEDPGMPGISFFWVEGGSRVVNAVRGFVRVRSGGSFPTHEHVGLERVLVLQGTYSDTVTGERVGPGTLVERAPGTAHGLAVTPNGPDLLQLSVVERGVVVNGERIDPRR
jgi:hypothetical protein